MKNSHSSAFSFYFARKFYRDKTGITHQCTPDNASQSSLIF